MRFYDGELEPARAELVAARLGTDGALRAKLAGMRIVGAFVREASARAPRTEGIADAVMSALEAPATPAEASEREAPRTPQGAVASLGTQRAANDNARLIFGLVAMAATVALGLFFWGRAEPAGDLAASAPREGAAETAAPGPARRTAPSAVAAAALMAEPAPASEPAPSEEEPPRAGVEIAAVDFGAQQGSVFFVAAEQGAAATAVIWVNEQEP
jgi:hypothetical protein